MTSPTPDPDRPEKADRAALFDAVAVEHAAIYGYGFVSAHSSPTRTTWCRRRWSSIGSGARRRSRC